MAVCKEQIELPVQVGVDEGCAPAHTHERGSGDARGRARILEVPAIDAAIERVTIVGERGEHEVHPPVTIVVAGIDAHARLRARVAVHRDPAARPTLSNRPFPRL